MRSSNRNTRIARAALILVAVCSCLALIGGSAHGQGTYKATDEDGIERDLPNEKDLPFDFLKVHGQPQRCGMPIKKTDATGRVTISSPTGSDGSCKLFYSLKNSNDPHARGKLGVGAPAPGTVDRWRWILNPNNFDPDFTYTCFTGVKKDFPDLKHGSYSATDDDGIERYLPDEKDLPFEFVLDKNGQPKKCGKPRKETDATGNVTISCPAGACAPEYPGSDCKLFFSLKDTTDAHALGKLGVGAPRPGSVDRWRWILNPNNYDRDFTHACFCVKAKGAMPSTPKEVSRRQLKIVDLDVAIEQAVMSQQLVIKRQIADLELAKEVLARSLPDYQSRADKALQVSSDIADRQASIAQDFQVIADRLRKLQEQKPTMPESLKPLANQKASLEKDIARREALVARLRAEKSSQDLRPATEQLDSDRAQLAKVNQMMSERMPPAPDTSAQQAPLKDRLKQLDEELFQLQKDGTHAQTELELAAAGLQRALDKRAELDEQLTNLGGQLKGMDAKLMEISGSANGKPVYNAKREVEFSKLKDLNREIAETKQLLQQLRDDRERARTDFLKASDEARDARAQIVHAIYKTAYTKVAIEFGYQLFDIGKAGSKGGPVGALTEASRKIAENLAVWGQEGLGLSVPNDVDPESIEAEVNRQFGADLKDSFGFLQLDELLMKRLIKDSYTRMGKEAINKGFGANLAQKQFCNAYRSMAELHADINFTSDTVKRHAEKLAKMKDNVDELKKSGYKLSKLGESAFKDVTKTFLKAGAETIERDAWISFFEKDIVARSYYPVYATTDNLYWQVYDKYDGMLKKKADLEEGYNPNCGFKTYFSEAFDDDQTVTVNLRIERPRESGHTLELKVALSGVEMAPSGNDTYRVEAAQLRADAGGGLILKVH